MIKRTGRKKAPMAGLEIYGFSVSGCCRSRVRAAAYRTGGASADGQPVQPGAGSRPVTQTARTAGHGLRGAAQNAQTLFVKLVMNGASGVVRAFFRLTGPVQIKFHCVLRRVAHGEILKAGSDAVMSIQWQLRDSALGGCCARSLLRGGWRRVKRYFFDSFFRTSHGCSCPIAVRQPGSHGDLVRYRLIQPPII